MDKINGKTVIKHSNLPVSNISLDGSSPVNDRASDRSFNINSPIKRISVLPRKRSISLANFNSLDT